MCCCPFMVVMVVVVLLEEGGINPWLMVGWGYIRVLLRYYCCLHCHCLVYVTIYSLEEDEKQGEERRGNHDNNCSSNSSHYHSTVTQCSLSPLRSAQFGGPAAAVVAAQGGDAHLILQHDNDKCTIC